MNTLAAVEATELRNALVKIDLTGLKKARLNILLNSLRRKFGLELLDYLAPAAGAASSTPSSSSGPAAGVLDAAGVAAIIAAVKEKPPVSLGTVKVAHVLDQSSADELTPLDEKTVDALRGELHATLGGEPLESEEFTDNQLTAFKRRLDAGLSPACDYAVLGPYGSRLERRMKFMGTLKDPSGHERTVEISGPDSLDTWEACHALFKNLCLACKVAKAATLDNFRAKFKERVAEFPGQWGLAMAADHICRTELWPRLRSQMKRMHEDPATRALSTFDPLMPWDAVIAASGTDSDFWNKNFDRKALKAIASGRSTGPAHAQLDSFDDVGPGAGKRRRGAGRLWERGPKGQQMQNQPPVENTKRPDGRYATDNHQRFCWEYHHRNGCNESTCPQNMSHRCEFCKGWHRTTSCGQKPQGWTPPEAKGKNKGGKGKGNKGDKGGKNGKETWKRQRAW